MLNNHRVTNSSPAEIEAISLTYVPPTSAGQAETSKEPNVWRRPLITIGALGAGVLFVAGVWFFGEQSKGAGKASNQPKIDQLEASNQELTNQLIEAQDAAAHFGDLWRQDAARASTLNKVAAKQALPWLHGRVDVYTNGVKTDSIGNPIVLSPSFGAYGVQPNAQGWQAVVSQSASYAKGVEAYTRDAQNTTFKFYDEQGEPLTDDDLWNSPYVRISEMEIEETLDGWSQITTVSGQFIGSSDHAG